MAVSPLAEVLACPCCRAALDGGGTTACAGCGKEFAAVDGIPWLLPEPSASLADWHLRLKHLTQRLDGEVELLKLELKEPALSELTTKRLRKILQAKVEHRKALAELLAPLEASTEGSEELSSAMNVRLPARQTITSYINNIFRDWAWETEENRLCLDAVLEVLPKDAWKGKRVLILGAGYGRLAYDLHQTAGPALTVATDINPLMLIAAKRLFKGKALKLHEFALAPRDLESHAVLRKCTAATAANPGLELVFADALKPPFKAGAFDVVLTPWLIDILPPSLPQLAATINDLLVPGGTFVNFGPLGFNHARSIDNLSLEEVLETVTAAGFAVGEPRRHSMPYMQSPASAHGRIELVTAFAAKKTGAAAIRPASFVMLPAWLTGRELPVPRLKSFDTFTIINSILIDTLAMIDGKRTMAELAGIFAAKHGLPVAEAESSVRGFLVKQFEQAQTGRQH